MEWFRQATLQGHELAALIVEEIESAEQSDPGIQYSLGQRYCNGDGVGKDYAEAAKWFRRAAQKDFSDAQYAIAMLHRNGQGVKKNNDIATDWLRKAAEQGDKRALMFFEDLRC
jgi:TPR repeat protein